ncbi:MAG: C10 family peptidase [Kiritimatiellae bacterium]|nr:C10 family peptidase [Kiritimatiellia bacterium]
MRHWIMFFCLFAVLQVHSAWISETTALEGAQLWMAGNPVMGPAGRSVASVERFPESGYQVYVVHLAPKGYLVLNSDSELPLMVAFSADSSVVLEDIPENALRTMLLGHVKRMAALLRQPAALALLAQQPVDPQALSELHGPALQTSWNQCNPYNKLCPDDPAGTQYYGYRAPAGCVPVAYAQIMNFHRWPLHGYGAHTYTDSAGAITGAHSADFSGTYSWGSMLSEYNPWSSNFGAAESAVAELMYELGVAAEADYEHGGTSSSAATLGSRLGEYFYYEPCVWSGSQSALIAPLEADLRAGLPCVVAIPGHAIVADGLMVDNGVTTYHINYGWGGTNNGWWDANNVAGAPLAYGVTSLRPKLLAFPASDVATTTTGEASELGWVLPKQRAIEAEKLSVFRLEEQASPWVSDGSEINATINSGWKALTTGGKPGACWYAGPNGPAAMVLDEILLPDASTTLTFWIKNRLGTATFTVSISTNGGLSYIELYSDSERYNLTWRQVSLSLAGFAGESVQLRFELSVGGYYTNGGVWVDTLAMTSGYWKSWEPFFEDNELESRSFSSSITESKNSDDFSINTISTPATTNSELDGQPVHYTTLTNLPVGIHTLAAKLTDTQNVTHALAPPFTLFVYDNDGMPVEWEELHGLDPFTDDGALDPDQDGYTNLQEYIAGTDPNDSNSIFRISIDGRTINWPALEGRTYRVLKADNPAGPFDVLQTLYGPTSNFTDNASALHGFYKVSVELCCEPGLLRSVETPVYDNDHDDD